MLEKIKSLDLFAAQIPTFNVAGKSWTRTLPGAISSISIVAMTFIFGLMKLEHMVLRRNPQISTNVDRLEDSVSYDIG